MCVLTHTHTHIHRYAHTHTQTQTGKHTHTHKRSLPVHWLGLGLAGFSSSCCRYQPLEPGQGFLQLVFHPQNAEINTTAQSASLDLSL